MDPIGRDLARTLREWRDELGMTQEQAAARCNVSVRHWRDIEGGTSSPTMAKVGMILAGLGRSWHELADRLEQVRQPGAPPGLHDRLDRAWTQASPAQRKAIRAALRAIVELAD